MTWARCKAMIERKKTQGAGMDLNKVFERGSQAFERGNWELAIMMWQQVLAADPNHADARKMIREAENRKWVQRKPGARAKPLALAAGLGPMVSYVRHMLRKRYDRALADCERALAHDPNNVIVLWALVRAALQGGYPKAAMVTLEYLRDRNPKNARALRRLGLLYEEEDNISQAIETWEKLRSVLPDDREAATKLRDLAAVQTMVDGRYETATQKDATFQVSLKSKEDSQELEDEHRAIRTAEDLGKAIERVTKDVEENPEQKRYVIQLGNLYRKAGQFEKARGLYERALKLDSMDFSIPELLGELRIDEYAAQEKALAEKLKAAPDGEAPGGEALKSQLAAVRKEKFQFSMEEYKRQVQVRPTDSGLHVKLADLYFGARMFDEAGMEYQKASTESRLHRYCRMRMGICLYNTGKHQLAVGQFEQAIKGGTAANRDVKDIMYYLAVALEKLGDLERAEEFFHKIFDVDMSYKDVQVRLDKVMRARQSGVGGSQAGGKSG